MVEEKRGHPILAEEEELYQLSIAVAQLQPGGNQRPGAGWQPRPWLKTVRERGAWWWFWPWPHPENQDGSSTERSEEEHSNSQGGLEAPITAVSRNYMKKSLWERACVSQPAFSDILYTIYPTASASPGATDLPVHRGAITIAMAMPSPGRASTWGSALPATGGVINGTTATNCDVWRKRDPLKHWLHLYKMGGRYV